MRVAIITGYTQRTHEGGAWKYTIEARACTPWELVRYNVYHWYDMRFPIWFEEKLKLRKLFQSHRSLYPLDNWWCHWMVEQDLRCYHYSQAGEKIGRIEVTKEEWYRYLDLTS